MVRVMGLEPTLPCENMNLNHAPQACLSAYSSTLANESLNRRLVYYSILFDFVKSFFQLFYFGKL